ncbi:MAG: cyclic pyranopterin monophosphate synthase MoaC [Pacificimonas sp.]
MADLTHLDTDGNAYMVDISAKPATKRIAVAEGRIHMSPMALSAISSGTVPKGDVLAAARIAGIMAAKKTADLIPLCHPLPLTGTKVDLAVNTDHIHVTASVSTTFGTGVEMEAMTATSIALLTVYDMAKALDKAMVIGGVRLLSKEGGKSGHWHAPEMKDD